MYEVLFGNSLFEIIDRMFNGYHLFCFLFFLIFLFHILVMQIRSVSF